MSSKSGGMDVAELKAYFAEAEERILTQYYEFLRFKSISADPAYTQECLECASWLEQKLQGLGFTVQVIETAGKPIVLAKRSGNPGAKHILYYGHYDVQPADPLAEWNSDPFEPVRKDDKVFARGALDNKGQTFYFLAAVEALIEHDALDNELTILIEGEEEVGSPNLIQSLPELSDSLQADVLLVCDTDCFRQGLPTITMGLRGIISLEVTLRGPNRDLHSGLNGGVCKNPASEMARLIASLHDDRGAIAVAGYYEGIRAPSDTEQRAMDALGFSDQEYQQEHGVLPSGGEQGIAPLERIGFRPTIEINGLYSGYTGAGGKTIIPASATVKISSRIAGAQEPARCLELLQTHFRAHAPKDLVLEFPYKEIGGAPFFMSADTPCVVRARELLQEIFGVEPALLWEGASIPVVADLAQLVGGQALLIGFGLAQDNIHAPNESFAIKRFLDGFLYAAIALQKL